MTKVIHDSAQKKVRSAKAKKVKQEIKPWSKAFYKALEAVASIGKKETH